jgi:lysophospholipase L1-like esterase
MPLVTPSRLRAFLERAHKKGVKEFDGMIDFDQPLADPSHPVRILPAYDSGDHLHPNDAGYVATANAVPLALFGCSD